MFKAMVDKILSARFIATLMVVGTMCYCVVRVFAIVELSISDPQKYTVVKDFLMFVMGGFTATVSTVITSYFNRSDRPAETKKDVKTKEVV